MDEKDEQAAMMAVLDDMEAAAKGAKKSKYAPKPKAEEMPETPAEEAEEPSQEMEVSPAELEALLGG